jgi:hypothetical protein
MHVQRRKLTVKLGVALPLIDVEIGGDPAAVREFAQARTPSCTAVFQPLPCHCLL